MPRYIVLPIKRDPVEASEQFTEVIRRQFPTWEAADGDPMTLVREGVSVLYADVGELATRASEELFRYFGRGLAGLPPTEERAASGTVTVTAQDAAGPYVVPEGLEVVGRGPLGEPIAFVTVAAVVVPNGATTAVATVEAVDPGVEANSVSGVAEFGQYVDYLTDVVFNAPTSAGEDREGDAPFLDRLSEDLELQSPRPITPSNFAVLARALGAYRATAIDGLDPSDGSTGNRAMVAVAMIDEAGNDLSGPEVTRIGAELARLREVGFAVPIIGADRTGIDVSFEATAYPGWDPDDVRAAAIAQLTSYLSPSRWGANVDAGEERVWLNEPVVRYLEVAERLQRVEGLRYVDELSIAEAGVTLDELNVVMTGYAPLPTPGNIVGTVDAG